MVTRVPESASVVARAPRTPVRVEPSAGSAARVSPASVLAFAAGAAFLGTISWLALARHAAFSTGRFDLEIYTQVVWNTAHGNPFETTLLKSNLSHLAEHVALVLLPLAAVYKLLPDPRVLLLAQQVALAAIGLPLFLAAYGALRSRWQAALVVASFYLCPALAGVSLDDFHAVALAGLPLAVGLALVFAGRPAAGGAAALASMVVEEEAALVVIGLGMYLIAARRWRLGVVIGVAASLWLAAAVFYVMPAFHDPRTLDSVQGNRTLSHFTELRLDPTAALVRLLAQRGPDALGALALPTGGIGVLAPSTLLVAAPSVAALLVQDRDDTFARHWVLPSLVAVWFATVRGLARVPDGRPRRVALGALAAGALLSYWQASPLPAGGAYDPSAIQQDERSALLERAIQRIPEDGVVVASPNVVAHVANRREVYVYPIDSHYAEELGWRKKRPDFYVLDLNDELTNRATNSERLNPLNADRPYNVWSSGPKVLVLSDVVGEPAVPLGARFGDRFLLKGYDIERTKRDVRLIMHWDRYGELRGRYDRDLSIFDQHGVQQAYQEDMALSRTYGSNKWQPGQIILDEVVLPDVPGPLTVRVAWVAQEKRVPFRLEDGSGAYEFVVPAVR